MVRPSFTLGGSGSGIARYEPDLRRIAGAGLDASPVTEVLLEESILGWKEFELELMRDRHDNVVIVCSIENIDPMGVHTGDSVTVAPAMTLTDREYQHMRDVAIAIDPRGRGGHRRAATSSSRSHPQTGRMVVIEMNPRVSRSSALASKATGFPIAKIAARLAIGYTLDEIRNDITGETPASFEPALDYVVVKVPRFAFEKFPGADPELTTHMKSVGEAMAIGRSLPRGAAEGAPVAGEHRAAPFSWARAARRPRPSCSARCASPARRPDVHGAPGAAGRGDRGRAWRGRPGSIPGSWTRSWASRKSHGRLAEAGTAAAPGPARPGPELDTAALRAAKAGRVLRRPDRRSSRACRKTRSALLRHALGVRPVYHTVDTCAAEFAARTPYLYSTYDEQTEVPAGGTAQGDHPRQRAEPDRPGHRVRLRLRARVVRAVRRGLRDRDGQLQPGDRVDRLRHLRPAVLRAADAGGRARGGARRAAERAGRRGDRAARRARRRSAWPARWPPRACRSWAPRPDAIHLAEDRGEFGGGAGRRPDCPRPGTASRCPPTRPAVVADEIGYPVLVRPSYVLGGRGMEIVYDEATLRGLRRPGHGGQPGHPVLIDRFLDDAIEIDVDALYDGEELFLGGVMEHIEEAGIHSGDSACALPPITLGRADIAADPRIDRGHRAGRRGARAAQRAVRAGGRGAVRAGGQPAGVADRAVRVQGDRRAAGQGGGPDHAGRHGRRRCAAEGLLPADRRRRHAAAGRADRGQGGGAAVRPVPRRARAGRGHRARP